jgi:hypothetical protein
MSSIVRNKLSESPRQMMMNGWTTHVTGDGDRMTSTRHVRDVSVGATRAFTASLAEIDVTVRVQPYHVLTISWNENTWIESRVLLWLLFKWSHTIHISDDTTVLYFNDSLGSRIVTKSLPDSKLHQLFPKTLDTNTSLFQSTSSSPSPNNRSCHRAFYIVEKMKRQPSFFEQAGDIQVWMDLYLWLFPSHCWRRGKGDQQTSKIHHFLQTL